MKAQSIIAATVLVLLGCKPDAGMTGGVKEPTGETDEQGSEAPVGEMKEIVFDEEVLAILDEEMTGEDSGPADPEMAVSPDLEEPDPEAPPSVFPSVGASPSPAQIKHLIKTGKPHVEGCFGKGLDGDVGPGGSMSVQFEISTSGAVAWAKVLSSSPGHEKFENCIIEGIQKMEFPAGEQPTVVTFPIDIGQ